MLGRFGKVCFSYTFSCRLHAFPVRRTIFVTSSNLRSSKFCYVSGGSLFRRNIQHMSQVHIQTYVHTGFRNESIISILLYVSTQVEKNIFHRAIPPVYLFQMYDITFHKFHGASLYTGIMCCFAFSRLRRNCTKLASREAVYGH